MLGMGFGLDGSSHVPEGHQWLTVFHHKPGDDGVKRPFARRHDVRACRIKRERRASVVEYEAIGGDGCTATVEAEHAVN